ncbi:MAG: 16S rRNA (guanine(527)-N(7))-methyltransferase RsmG [Clostridia bacterium]
MKNIIKTLFKENYIEVNENQLTQFKKYYDMVIETNKVMNLTTITQIDEFCVKHLYDSVFPHMEIPQHAKLLDIGSGAGFPAIPLKILRNDLNITMIDSLEKRTSFCNQVIKNLNILNIIAKHSRAEDFAKENKEKFDIVVARAVASLSTLCELALPFLKIGGKFLAYKTYGEQEIIDAKNAINLLGGRLEKVLDYNLPQNFGNRCIIVVKKIGQSPKQYPRLGNKPKTNPL